MKPGAGVTPEQTTTAVLPFEIVTVCSHNRTRSVMSMAMLQDGFNQRLGDEVVIVRSLGFGPEGLPPIPDAVDAMRRRGLDISEHRSCRVSADRITSADLVLTAEKDHVIRVAEQSPTMYRRAFTLPEFCDRIVHDPIADGRSIRDWMTELSEGRTAGGYLREYVAEVFDPTGSALRQFEAAVVDIETMCRTVVNVMSCTT